MPRSAYIALTFITALLCNTAFAALELVRTDPQGLVFTYRPEALPADVDDGLLRLRLRDADVLAIPGKPQLPVKMVNVAVPPGSKPTARVVSRASGRVWNARLPISPQDDSGSPLPQPLSTFRDETLGNLELHSLNGLLVLRIPVFPAETSLSPDRVELASEIQVRVDFNAPPRVDSRVSATAAGHNRGAVLNYEQARGWGRHRTSNFTEPYWPQGWLYSFTITEEGIYKATFDQLKRSGFSELGSGVPSGQIKLFGNKGMDLPVSPLDSAVVGLLECAIHIEDGGDGRFEPGDYLLFYAKPAGGWAKDASGNFSYLINHYAIANRYWLNLDPSGGGKRMSGFNQPGVPDQTYDAGLIRYYSEQDKFIYAGSSFPGSGLEWYAYRYDGAARLTHSIRLDAPLTTEPASVKARMVTAGGAIGGIVNLEVNFSEVGQRPVGGIMRYDELQEYLQDGLNRLTFDQTTGNAIVHFDWFELSYWGRLDRARIFETPPFQETIRFDVSLPGQPWIFDLTDHNNVGLERRADFTVTSENHDPGRFAVMGSDDFLSITSPLKAYFPPPAEYSLDDLWSPGNRCDVIAIVPDDFWSAVGELIEFYRRTPAPREPRRNLTAAAVRISEIYNRFSGGIKDPAAIRNFLHYAVDHWNGPPGYVVLCADGDYNYRDIDRPEEPNLIPPVERGSYSFDDWFTDFSRDPDTQYYEPLPELAISRLTARSTTELRTMIDKIIAYNEDPAFGVWRNRVTLVADDEYGNSSEPNEPEHVRFNEELSTVRIPTHFDKTKIYLTEYARQHGREKPQSADDLLKSINQGTLLVNYMGHGNPTLWAHEHVFVMSKHFSRIERSRKLPLYLAFTCDWAYWDEEGPQSFPEQLLAAPGRGAIGAIASTRLTYSGGNMGLARPLFPLLLDEENRWTMAEALRMSKWEAPNNQSATYHLLGDPITRLAYPNFSGRFQELEPYPLTPLVKSQVSGEVFGASNVINPALNGEIEFQVLDTQVPRTYLAGESVLKYNLPGPLVYRGPLLVNNGRFEGSFIVPIDVTMGGQLGRIVGYFNNDETDAVFARDSIAYASHAADASDNAPPTIKIYFEHRGYRPGDPVGQEPLLIADISDPSGLNLTGAMGHGINVSIDGGEPVELTNSFRYDLDSYQSGSVEQVIGPLDAGRHQLVLEAWDSFNNLALLETEVDVVAGSNGFLLDRVLNWPNPFKESTYLTFNLNADADYEVKVFTVGGKLLREFGGSGTRGFNRGSRLLWDGRDSAGRRVGNGVYLFKVKAWDESGNYAEGLGKAVMSR